GGHPAVGRGADDPLSAVGLVALERHFDDADRRGNLQELSGYRVVGDWHAGRHSADFRRIVLDHASDRAVAAAGAAESVAKLRTSRRIRKNAKSGRIHTNSATR